MEARRELGWFSSACATGTFAASRDDEWYTRTSSEEGK